MTRLCQPPLPPGRRPSFPVPPGACDCHTHVFGPYARFPLAEDRSYTMPETLVEDHAAHLDALGFARGVVVTASVQGTDNSNLLDALRRFPDRLRGIAVLGAEATDRQIDELHAAGTRGVRLNLAGSMRNGVGLEVLPKLAPRLRERGWHLQVWIHVDRLAEALPHLEPHGMALVVDHMGKPPPGEAALRHPGFRLLCDLLREERAWVKISGADRVDEGVAPWPGADAPARALLAANPARCVWGSDWPHVAYYPPRPVPEDAALADRLAAWLPDEALRRRVLVDNPAQLYGF
ncbi:amidohydrolase family protein [Crenalkalicoccus roseus]|uniref:amidohydrolase family protein n=1 Tax=Crenalkalicoccus roseus TaxID=1485588 RepID=UPI0010809369|nr:amidohydrolase family protein [Crenalkalicoccus roseus]